MLCHNDPPCVTIVIHHDRSIMLFQCTVPERSSLMNEHLVIKTVFRIHNNDNKLKINLIVIQLFSETF